ncbi:MAG TPA: dockerin type I domain-containing protein [Gemmatimonadaceae bacterium]|nr:dockerin type I domain-containing protein [Gemmatimonadaceae bacterium]
MSPRLVSRFAAGTVAALLALGSRALGAQDKPDGKEDVRGRMEYFLQQRAYPFDSLPKGAMAAARASAANMRRNAAFVSAGTPWLSVGPVGLQAPDGYWTSAPQSDEGRITSIAVHPTNSQIAIAGSASGGVWRTTSGGASWTPVTDNQCSLATGSVAFDPVNPSIVYVGTGEVGTAWYGCGVLRSTDGGNTWTQLGASVFDPPSGAGASMPKLLIDRTSAGSTSSTIVFAATNTGLYRSTNSGTSWTQLVAGQFTDLAQHPTDANIIYAASGNLFTDTRSGVYRSGDRGATWTKLPLPLSTQGPGRAALAVTPALPKSVFLAASVPVGAGSPTLQGLWRWDDDLARWTQLAAAGVYAPIDRGDFGTQTWYNLVLAVDPIDANRIYLGGTRLYRSTDGGATFTRIANNTHVDWHALVIDPRSPTTLFGGNDGGVHVSYDGGNSWLSRNTNLSITQFYPGIAVHPSLPNQIVGGLQDNGTVMGTGLPTWDALFGGDGGYAAINYQDPTVSWVTCQWANPPCIYRRASSPTVRFDSRIAGINGTDRAAFIPPLVMDPTTPTTLYFGTLKLYKTTNDGVTWTTSGTDLSKGNGNISAIAPSLADPQVVYVGTNDGNVQVSTDGGTSFTLRTTGLPNRAVTDIAVDRANAQRAVVTFSGFGVPHVYLTTDGGGTWTSVSNGLPDVPHNAVALIPGGNRIFVGTDLGVYESGDNGATWTPGPSGMPNVTVTDLVYHGASGTLIAATHGRGVFLSSLTAAATVLRGDVNRDGSVTALDALFIQQALVGIAMPAGVTALPQGDANCNGRLDAADALLVLRFSVSLPVQGACVGTVR